MSENLNLSRRVFTAGLVGLGLAGCSAAETVEGSSGSGGSTGSDGVAGTTGLPLATISSAVSSSELVGAEVEDVQEWIKATVYDEDAQAAVAAEIEAAKGAGGYNIDAPLAYYNPFGTNTLSLFLYFETGDAAQVGYTVSVSDELLVSLDIDATSDAADFTRSVDGGAYGTSHEFSLIGLIPGVTNTVTLTATFEDGSSEQAAFSLEVPGLLGDEELQLEVEQGSSGEALADGLYVILGNDSTDADFMFYYDNQGIIRGEVPVIGYRSHRMLFDDDGTMYYSASQSKMAAMNALGQIVAVYNLGDFDLHHDYVWYDSTRMLVLATDTSRDDSDEDLVVLLDTATGEVTQLVDMGELIPEYKEAAFAYHEANYEGDDDDVAGWMHINSIQYLPDGDAVLLSSRETSTIFKVSGISTEPTLDYLLASELFWEGTAYEDLVFSQAGSFLVHGGQHCLTYVEDESLDAGQYYLQFYNNNLGVSASTTNDFDYAGAGIGEGSDPGSYYYEYLVDENERTFALTDSLEVAYSGYVSSVQWVDGNLLIDSGTLGYFTEYDASYEPICSFSMGADKFIYRVFKYGL